MNLPGSQKNLRPARRRVNAITRLLPLVAVIALGGWLVVSQYLANRALRRRLAQLGDETTAIAAQRAENRHLAELALNSTRLRREVAALPTNRTESPSPKRGPTPATRPILAEIVVTPAQTVEWNGVEITLADFIRRLASTASDPASAQGELVVRASNTDSNALLYVIDEVRKAGITHLVVHSDVTPSRQGWMQAWF